VASNVERWNAFFPGKDRKILIIVVVSVLFCFKEDVVQLMSHIAETWVYRSFLWCVFDYCGRIISKYVD